MKTKNNLRFLVDDKNKEFSTCLVLGPKDRFYTPSRGSENLNGDKSYIHVPKDCIVYYPFNYVNSDMILTHPDWMRIEHSFAFNGTSYQWKSIGRNSNSDNLHFWSNPLDFRFLLEEWAQANLYKYWALHNYGNSNWKDEAPGFYAQMKALEQTHKYVHYTFDNVKETETFGSIFHRDFHYKVKDQYMEAELSSIYNNGKKD